MPASREAVGAACQRPGEPWLDGSHLPLLLPRPTGIAYRANLRPSSFLHVLGIMDFTGELNRHAVLIATKRDICAVQKCRETLDLLNAQLMSFNWRNGNLRRKYDGVKYTLKKLEQIIYELTLASASVVPIIPKSGMDEPRPTGGSGGGDDEGMDGGDGGGDGGGDQFGDDLQGTSEGGAGRGGPAGSRGGRGGKRPRPAGQL